MLEWFDVFTLWEGWFYLFILSILEIVLGIDNIIFIGIITDKLEGRKKPMLEILDYRLPWHLDFFAFSNFINNACRHLFRFSIMISVVQSIILSQRSFFDLQKCYEMQNINHEHNNPSKPKPLTQIISQIVLIDLIFSFDSIIHVGMTNGIQSETETYGHYCHCYKYFNDRNDAIYNKSVNLF